MKPPSHCRRIGLGLLRAPAIGAIVAAVAVVLGSCGGGDEPPPQTYEQCYERCISVSCSGASGNGRLLCASSCANSCQR